MKKEKEFVEAEIVGDSPKKRNTFEGDFVDDQIKELKKTLLLKGGFFIAFWIIIFLLILGGIISLIFWLLPAILAFVLGVIILGIIINLTLKVFNIFKK